MKYEIMDGVIRIDDLESFNIEYILTCGQIFRYRKIKEGHFIVFSLNKKAEIFENEDYAEIHTKLGEEEYFVNFFDLKRDYSKIKKDLNLIGLSKDILNYGYGIRILNQDAFEMIVSFIVSANNNIKRIQNTIEKMCEKYGRKNEDYYCFPSLNELKNVTIEEFRSLGLGYRAPYLVETIKMLELLNLETLEKMNESELQSELLKLKGVGEKVADCIMLFGFHKNKVFPVDTWIKKVYLDLKLPPTNSPIKMRINLLTKYGDLSGYAQQYLFFYRRSGKEIN